MTVDCCRELLGVRLDMKGCRCGTTYRRRLWRVLGTRAVAMAPARRGYVAAQSNN
jgi:hypothetical protein